MMRRLKRIGRFLDAVMHHPRVPRWLKVGLGVLLVIPGPIDEALAAVILLGLALAHRDVVAECWEGTRTSRMTR